MARGNAARCRALSLLGHSWLVTAAAAILLVAQGVVGQKVRVDEMLEAYPTESVDLRCLFVDELGTKLTQVSWIWERADGQRDNIAVFHPLYGESFPNPSFTERVAFTHKTLENPSIRISNLKMSDAGRYTCEYATYPTGNEQGTTTLIMLAKTKNSANVVTVQAGSKSVVVARCEAADGKPAATIKWLASVGGNHSTSTTNGPDGTVTVRSEYRLVPTPADNGREVSCRVDQRTQERPWVYPIKLSVEYPPSVSIEGYDNNWYVGRSDAVLTCLANANPPPNISWTTASGSMPDTVSVEGNKLMVRKVDYAVNTTFTCEVKNKLGASRHQITTIVIEALEDPSSTGVVAGAVIGSLLALLLVVALIGVLLTRSRRQRSRGYPSSGDSIATGSGGSGGNDYGNKARLLFSGNSSSKNGTGGGNNNGPIYTYREGCDATGTLTEKANDFHHHHHHLHHPSLGEAPSAHDILLSSDMDEAERRKFDLDESLEEEEERYERFGGGGGSMLPPAYHVRRGHAGDGEMDVYLDDDMESQKDGSVISRTAIYV